VLARAGTVGAPPAFEGNVGAAADGYIEVETRVAVQMIARRPGCLRTAAHSNRTALAPQDRGRGAFA